MAFSLSVPLLRRSEERAEGGRRAEKVALLEPRGNWYALTTVRQAVLTGVEADLEPWASWTFTGLSVARAPTRASCPQAEKPRRMLPKTKRMEKP